MSHTYTGRAIGNYYFYRNGNDDRIRFSWDMQDPETGEDLPLEGWGMSLSTAEGLAASLLAITYPTRWQMLRAAWKAGRRKSLP